MSRPLRRSNNVVISGVAAGLSEYLGLDPTIGRILLVLAAFVSGGVVFLLYVAAIFVMPK